MFIDNGLGKPSLEFNYADATVDKANNLVSEGQVYLGGFQCLLGDRVLNIGVATCAEEEDVGDPTLYEFSLEYLSQGKINEDGEYELPLDIVSRVEQSDIVYFRQPSGAAGVSYAPENTSKLSLVEEFLSDILAILSSERSIQRTEVMKEINEINFDDNYRNGV